jgi:hypothetical protein
VQNVASRSRSGQALSEAQKLAQRRNCSLVSKNHQQKQ